MIHRPENDSTFSSKPFDLNAPLESCNALQSSLFELKNLQSHYIKEVAEFAKDIEKNYRITSSNPRDQTALTVEKYIDYSYKDMIKAELKARKKHYALADHAPKDNLFIQRGLLGQLFGSRESQQAQEVS
jgi:hypothetical protein